LFFDRNIRIASPDSFGLRSGQEVTMMTQQGNSNSRGMRMADEESRWHAVLARDPSFDGAFVYAVRSTGIYCRPWCPARRPRRQEVLSFPDLADAGQAEKRPQEGERRYQRPL